MDGYGNYPPNQPVDYLTIEKVIQIFRQLVLEHPEVSQLPIEIVPHGFDHQQRLEWVHLNFNGTAVVLEARP